MKHYRVLITIHDDCDSPYRLCTARKFKDGVLMNEAISTWGAREIDLKPKTIIGKIKLWILRKTW